MLPFSFQKGNKAAGCEDAPPVANARYSIVCDGLGGAGLTKHKVEEAGAPVLRTSGYLGSRMVADSVSSFYETNYDSIAETVLEKNSVVNALRLLAGELKQTIATDLFLKMSALGIDPALTKNRTLKIFPTTLASALYIQDGQKCYVLGIWAGDSRIYVLSPTKGLQLLSLDDAANAAVEMNSASEMNNCISAGNSFRLNYSLFELEEQGIVFCCSDGCFDYLQSPLHFEWLLVQTILSCIPDTSTSDVGESFAIGVRDSVYQSIGDDTTMAGVIYKINSTKELKRIFSSRMELLNQQAIRMNDALRIQRNCQNEKDSAAKKCRLSEEKVISDLEEAIAGAFLYKTPVALYSFISCQPCYVEYQNMLNDIDRTICEEREAELEEVNCQIQELRKVCADMIIRDYLRWRRQSQDSVSSGSAGMDFLFLKTRNVPKRSYKYLKPSTYLQPLRACVQLFSQPDFQRIGMSPQLSDGDFAGYMQSLVSNIEDLIAIMENENPLFEDMWSQAYFSTERFEEERMGVEHSREYPEIIENALDSPMSCGYVSELTIQKIDAYKKKNNDASAIRQKYMSERENRIKNASSRFFLRNEKELVESFFAQSAETSNGIFEETNVSMERLISFVEARRVISEMDLKLKTAQENVMNIWDLYRPDYQLFNKITEKGTA